MRKWETLNIGLDKRECRSHDKEVSLEELVGILVSDWLRMKVAEVTLYLFYSWAKGLPTCFGLSAIMCMI